MSSSSCRSQVLGVVAGRCLLGNFRQIPSLGSELQSLHISAAARFPFALKSSNPMSEKPNNARFGCAAITGVHYLAGDRKQRHVSNLSYQANALQHSAKIAFQTQKPMPGCFVGTSLIAS